MKSPRTAIARQFGLPRGPLGRVIGRGMARANGDFSRWVVDQLVQDHGDAELIVELGPGPGVGLEALLHGFPGAQVWGIDPSSAMLAQSRRRNAADVAAGRLALVQGGPGDVAALGPVDIVMANHVLYFWQEPVSEVGRIHAGLRQGGLLALGYQVRTSMPPMAQQQFPEAGHQLYDSTEQVADVLDAAGFAPARHLLKGPPNAPHGRLTLARRRVVE